MLNCVNNRNLSTLLKDVTERNNENVIGLMRF